MSTLKQNSNVSCKTRNHPQTSQITHKPAKPPTNQPNQPNHLQTSQMPNKSPTNQPKSHRYFPEDTFQEPQHFPFPSRAKRIIDALF